jgi:hypothetical protein
MYANWRSKAAECATSPLVFVVFSAHLPRQTRLKMRLLNSLLPLSFVGFALAQDAASQAAFLIPEQEAQIAGSSRFEYQSDVARLMKIVVGNRE